jgi:hypothetical protein
MIASQLSRGDARVIAAAPELLAACKRALVRILNAGDRDESTVALLHQIDAAIVKAEGKADRPASMLGEYSDGYEVRR